MTKKKAAKPEVAPVDDDVTPVAHADSPTLDEESLAAALDPTTEPMGKATGEVRSELRCLVCGNATDRRICPVDGNVMAEA